jgi:hypothetical protein
LFEKIYCYPTASAVNKRIVLHKKEEQRTGLVKKGLHLLYKLSVSAIPNTERKVTWV